MNDQLDDVVDYIRQHIAQGVPEDQIHQVLKQAHWTDEHIAQAFLRAKTPLHHPAIEPQTGMPSQVNPHSPDTILHGEHLPVEQPSTTAAVPKKYRVFRAIGDVFVAIKHNVRTFLLLVVVVNAGAVAASFLVTLATNYLVVHGPNPWVGMIVGLVLDFVWYLSFSSLILGFTALAISDGANKRKGSFGLTMQKGFRGLGRVMGANTLFTLITFGPLLLAIVIPLFVLPFIGLSALLVLPILYILASLWTLLATFRYLLAPYIALFEPEIAVTRTLRRSKELLAKGGQWFLLKHLLLNAAIILIFALVGGQTFYAVLYSDDLGINLILMLLLTLVDCVLVMLYRNRKIVNG